MEQPNEGWLGKLDYGPEKLELKTNQHINAGNYSIRKDVLFNVGGYPPCDAPEDKLVGDGEVGLNNKVYKNGNKIIWTPSAVGAHINDARTITISYMIHRSKQHGKGRSYTFYRESKNNLLKFTKYLLINSIGIIKNIISIILYYNFHNKKYYNNLFGYYKKLWSILYLIEILMDSELRDLVSENNWLND